MHSRSQSRQDLQIFGLVKVLAVARDLWRLGPPLLLRLPHLDPLLHGQVPAQSGERVFRQAQTLKDGALDGVEQDVVVWSTFWISIGEKGKEKGSREGGGGLTAQSTARPGDRCGPGRPGARARGARSTLRSRPSAPSARRRC